MIKLCKCGCGQQTNKINKTRLSRGDIKGHYRNFINGHQLKLLNSNQKTHNNPFWKGGIRITKMGYKTIRSPSHKRANNGYVFEHILIAEKALGKPLPLGVVIHHHHPDKRNIDLVICQDNNYHRLIERRTKAYRICGHADWLKCEYCRVFDDPINLSIVGKKRRCIYHKDCMNKYSRNRYAIKRRQK